MISRVIAVLVAAVLIWSGLSTTEAPRSLTQASAELQANVVADDLDAGHVGSMGQHHLDDLPWQAQSEPAAEPPGLVPAPPSEITPPGRTTHPRSLRFAAVASPFLEGPLRPPCSAAFAG
jgi:hypothetical protein